MVKHLFALLLLASFIFTCEGTPKHPVVLVPGLGASQLWIKNDREKVYKSEWIYVRKLVTQLSALLKEMTLDVHLTTGSVTDPPGYTIKACGFGNPNVLTNLVISHSFETTQSVAECDGDEGEYADDSGFQELINMIENGEKNISDICATCTKCEDPGSVECREEFRNVMGSLKIIYYYYYIVEALKKEGYTPKKDIKGAPYDFRKAPYNMKEFYEKLEMLVEDLYFKNNNVPVVMIAHSLGNPVLLNFYNKHTTKEWKDKYIHAHVALAPPWAGAVKPVKFIVSGDNLDLKLPSHITFRPMERSWPGIAWMMPSQAHGLWTPREPFVVTRTRNYSVHEYHQLFNDLGYPAGYLMLKKTKESVPDLSKLPEIRALHVLYGDNVDTPTQYNYPGQSFPDGTPQIITSKEGDGTVNKRSMEAFAKLKPNALTNLTHHSYDRVNHMEIMRDQRVLNFITDLVSNKTGNPSKTVKPSGRSLTLTLTVCVCVLNVISV